MDLFARNGFDVYLVDVRSYGRSTRPPEMDQPPEANKPIASSEEAGRDLSAGVDYILVLHGIPKLNLMGWSWGTSIAGNYAADHNDKINRRRGPPSLRSRRQPQQRRPIGSWRRIPRKRAGSKAFPTTNSRR